MKAWNNLRANGTKSGLPAEDRAFCRVQLKRRNTPMKYCSLLLLASVLATGAFAQSSTSTAPQPPPVNVVVESEARSLAIGYEAAFKQLSRPPLTIVFEKDGTLRVLEDVKQVRAAGGVVLAEVGRGLIYVINPKDIVYLTDGPQIVKK
jgi:hypothetical protein